MRRARSVPVHERACDPPGPGSSAALGRSARRRGAAVPLIRGRRRLSRRDVGEVVPAQTRTPRPVRDAGRRQAHHRGVQPDRRGGAHGPAGRGAAGQSGPVREDRRCVRAGHRPGHGARAPVARPGLAAGTPSRLQDPLRAVHRGPAGTLRPGERGDGTPRDGRRVGRHLRTSGPGGSGRRSRARAGVLRARPRQRRAGPCQGLLPQPHQQRRGPGTDGLARQGP